MRQYFFNTKSSSAKTSNPKISNIKIQNNAPIPKIPAFRIKEIKKLYEAIKHVLGENARIRRRAMISTLRIYYRWESLKTLEYMFDEYVKPIDIEYMTTIRAKKIKNEYGEMVKQLFGAMDDDNNGSIDLDEFKYALRKVDDIIPEELFNKADINSDGVLDQCEFYRLVASTPELRNNFELIITGAVNENTKKEYERISRIFKNDVTNRRPSLTDLRMPHDICSFDVPLYGIELPINTSETIKRRFGIQGRRASI